jgi:hypothetical protein
MDLAWIPQDKFIVINYICFAKEGIAKKNFKSDFESNLSKISLILRIKYFEPKILKYKMLGFLPIQSSQGVIFNSGFKVTWFKTQQEVFYNFCPKTFRCVKFI